MSENLLASVTADVMLYEDNSKQWVRPGENGLMATISHSGLPDVQKLSNIQLWQSSNKTAFKITAKRIYDGKLLIEQTLFQKLKYQAATKCFHQWRSESRQVFGLSFSCEQDAEKFLLMVQQAMEYLSSINEIYYPAQNGNGALNSNNNNGHYQESWYQQQQKQSNYCKEPDQDSIGSASGINSVYRKSSYSVNVTSNFCSTVTGMIQSQQPQQQQQQQQQQYSHYQQQSQQIHQQQQHPNNNMQRRASQSSNNSGSTNSSGTNNVSGNMGNGIYAQIQANGSNDYHSNTMNRLNINGPQTNHQLSNTMSNIQSQNSLLTETATSSSTCVASNTPSTTYTSMSIPPISNNIPPPPPPPPPTLKFNNGNKSISLVDQLQQKQMQLRSVSTNSQLSVGNVINRTSSMSADTGIGSKNSTINSTNSAHSDLFSELAATINKRKLANGITVSEERKTETLIEKKETASFIRPWQKTSNAGVSSASNNATNDSPKVHRKAASGSSLSSQEEPTIKNNTASNALNASGFVTLSDLDRLKQELILELNKTKENILNAMRQELAQYFQAK